MIILGIDPGFARMGVAILKKEKNKEGLVYSTCITSEPSEKNREKRLLVLAKELEQIILKYKPDILAIEKLFFFKNHKTVIQVAEAVGMILFLCAQKGLSVKEFTPLQIKIALTSYGRAEKSQVEKMVKAILKLEKIPLLDDETDAIAVALTCSAGIST